MYLLNLKNKLWDVIAEKEITRKNRLEEYKKNSDSLTSLYCSFSDNWFTIVKRIGSKSMCGEVYLLRMATGEQIAIKIMPITNEKSKQENNNEISIATKASQLVLDGKTDHFPLVYGHNHCKNTEYDEKSNFILNSQTWCLQNQISGEKGRKQGIKFFKSTHNMDINQKIEYVNKNMPDLDIKMELESDVLLSELAWGDLHSFLVENVEKMSNDDLYQMFENILEIIMDMQNKLHIVHNDFHTGNILVDMSRIGFNLLAHDFGKSKEIQIFTTEDYIQDVETIASKLIENYFENHPYMGSRLRDVLDFIEKEPYNDKIMMNIAELWKKIQ